jgi:hypothetical protein
MAYRITLSAVSGEVPMGIYNLQKVLDGHKAGKLAEALSGFDQNDLAYIVREMEQYLKKNEILEENQDLLQQLLKRIEELA